jgi:8-oxo-dGTP pyrophosphatase MutT (NUDIX family)
MDWRLLGSEQVLDAGIFTVRRDAYEYAGRPVHPFYVIESRPWVNIVAVTPGDEVVLVRQYRHGTRADSLEIPGGLVDPGDKDPGTAAARELLEETGYRGRIRPLGRVSSNPAVLSNHTHFFVAEAAEPVAAPSPDETECITVETVPVAALKGLLKSGAIHHSLCVCALALYLLEREP